MRTLGIILQLAPWIALLAWSIHGLWKTYTWRRRIRSILDPFGGSGTTGAVALELGRKAILIELNPDYCGMAQRRTDVTPGLRL